MRVIALRQRCLPILAVAAVLCAAVPAAADDWLVYLGGGLEPIEGGWDQRHGQVVYHKVGGTLVSVPFSEVDLPTSAFVTWQLNGRTEPPPRSPVPESGPTTAQGNEEECAKGKMVALRDSETLSVLLEGAAEPETVHVSCLDAPDTRHRFAELGWFGRAALSAIKLEVQTGQEVCLTEHTPPQRDKEGHRVVYVTLAGGQDYAASVIAAGLGLLRLGPCARADRYRDLETRAIATQRGLWGRRSERAAIAAAGNTIAIAGAPGGGAAPPRRIGGG